MRLRPVEHRDLAALVQIEQCCFGADAWSENLVGQEIAAPNRWIVLAIAASTQTPIGYASLSTAGELADLQRVAVRPEHRGTGVGRALLEACVEEARQRGCVRLLLEVAERNEAALRLYTAAGFAEIDRRRGYYADGADAVVCAYELIPPG